MSQSLRLKAGLNIPEVHISNANTTDCQQHRLMFSGVQLLLRYSQVASTTPELLMLLWARVMSKPLIRTVVSAFVESTWRAAETWLEQGRLAVTSFTRAFDPLGGADFACPFRFMRSP